MTAANASQKGKFPIFASTRFGNVLGSSGSVIPLFKRQILAGGPVTLTDVDMTRFVMTLAEAARLVMQSVFLACGGEVFVTKMPSIKIQDLAVAMVEILKEKENVTDDIEIRIIGSKPGEKLYEELINEEEVRRTIEIDNYFAVLPAFKSVFKEIEYGFEGGRTGHFNGCRHDPIRHDARRSGSPCHAIGLSGLRRRSLRHQDAIHQNSGFSRGNGRNP